MGYNFKEATIEWGKYSISVYFNMHAADFVDLLQQYMELREAFDAYRLSLWLARKIALEKSLLEQNTPSGWIILPKNQFDHLLIELGYETNTRTTESQR